MAHFALLNSDHVVIFIEVVHNNEAPDEATGIAFLESLYGPGYWVQTSYNGHFRRNYAGLGFTYDSVRDAFIPPKPFPSWVLNEGTCRWESPVPRPVDASLYVWDESTVSWVAI